jgi:hypothetical protein
MFGTAEEYYEPAEREAEKQAIVEARAAASRNARFDAANICGPGYEMIHAPSSGGARPRGQIACFGANVYDDPETGYLMIVMRDGKWIGYPDTPADLWDELKGALSTNDFIRGSLAGATWEETSYGSLPRKKPDMFNLGTEE